MHVKFCFDQINLGIDSTASYFGDPHLKYKCIRRVVDCIFEDEEGEIMHQSKEYFCLRLNVSVFH